ncbi:hypothetical protein AGMMS49938_00320 [Fibrobacterales bacterium]|nr:hypothetical protein AGMMS49938_00320 [Fibrobacterales bacterium]
MDKISQAQDLIAKYRPELLENRPVYEAILQFYSGHSLIETQILDLTYLLKNSKIELLKAGGESFKECVYNLLDEYPEITTAKGMLRFYECPLDFDWRECEKSEIVLGDALTQDIYGWKPDFWTVFSVERFSAENKFSIFALCAFS